MLGAQVHAVRRLYSHLDLGLHTLKPMVAMTEELVLKSMPKAERDQLQCDITALHNGGATCRSCYHRRYEIASFGGLMTTMRRQRAGELAEAGDYLARLMRWGFRVTHATWTNHHNRVVLHAAGLLISFQILMLRNVPLTKTTSTGDKPRELYGQFWHQLSHLVSELKRVNPMLTMSEWFEMLWGNLRRLTLGTSDRKEEHATWNMVIRTQVCAHACCAACVRSRVRAN